MDALRLDYWLGDREPKYRDSAVERSVRPTVTIRRARARLETIGVTRVADLTELDRMGIPNYMTVRPDDLGPGISYYNGKGATRAEALAGALMEAIERHAGELYDGPIVASSHYNLRHQHACIDPLEIHVPMVGGYTEHLLLEWALGFDLIGRQPTFAPVNCVVAPYRPSFAMPLFYSSTNGLASGNTRLEAVCHALCEIIERDALAMAMTRSHLAPAVAGVLEEMGFDDGQQSCRENAPPEISLQGLPRQAEDLVRRMQQAGLEVRLRNLTSATGIPTIACTVYEPDGPPGLLGAHGGCGTHPDARIALTRALTEAAQTRIACIQGGREDLPAVVRAEGRGGRGMQDGGGRCMAFDDIPSRQHAAVNDDVEWIIERMRQHGFAQAVVFDITRPDVSIPVVRIVVPRAESWPFFLTHGERAALGSRALQHLCNG